MKKIIRQSIGALLFTTTLITTSTALSQSIEATTTTTTSEGTVSEFGPQGIIIKTAAGAQPVRYISSETTNYVDEKGVPVSIELVKSGLPVTVYYTKVGDTLIATKIMVKRGVAVLPQIVQATTMSAGTISEFGPGKIIIHTAASPAPLRYTYSETTTYADENGTPIAIETVKPGLPVTVYYTQVGDTRVANKVIVRKAPLIEETKTTTTTTTIINK